MSTLMLWYQPLAWFSLFLGAPLRQLCLSARFFFTHWDARVASCSGGFCYIKVSWKQD